MKTFGKILQYSFIGWVSAIILFMIGVTIYGYLMDESTAQAFIAAIIIWGPLGGILGFLFATISIILNKHAQKNNS